MALSSESWGLLWIFLSGVCISGFVLSVLSCASAAREGAKALLAAAPPEDNKKGRGSDAFCGGVGGGGDGGAGGGGCGVSPTRRRSTAAHLLPRTKSKGSGRFDGGAGGGGQSSRGGWVAGAGVGAGAGAVTGGAAAGFGKGDGGGGGDLVNAEQLFERFESLAASLGKQHEVSLLMSSFSVRQLFAQGFFFCKFFFAKFVFPFDTHTHALGRKIRRASAKCLSFSYVVHVS